MNKLNSILAAGLFVAASTGIAAGPASAAGSSPPPAAGSSSTQMNQNQNQNQGAGMSKTRVERVQKALNDNGAKIAVDGIWGAKTTGALKQFQTSHGLKATGHLDKATLQQLKLQA